MASKFYALDSSEWYDTVQPGVFETILPEPNVNYCYAAMRLMSWFPVANSRGATYFSCDISDELIASLPFALANLHHKKDQIVGTIISAARTEQGIDCVVQIDRDAAIAHGLTMQALRAGNAFSRVSVELTRDPAKCRFLVVDDGYNIIRTIPTLAGRKAGVRRTTATDPYLYQGNRVIEAIVPERFTGLGFVPNPSDQSAELYALAADEETEESVLVNPTAPSALLSGDDSPMSVEEIATLEAALARLELELAAANNEKEVASAAHTALEVRLAEITSQLAAKETERASAVDELTVLRTEKDATVREASIVEILAKWEGARACLNDVERLALREQASAACGDDGVIRSVFQDRKIEALEAALAAAPAPVAVDPAIAAAAAAEAAAAEATAAAAAAAAEAAAKLEGEVADEFVPVEDPLVKAGAKLVPTYKGHKTSDLNKLS